MNKLVVKFTGIDSWGRPIFRSVYTSSTYLGDTDNLFSETATEEEVLSFYAQRKELIKNLRYFGTKFGCEPSGEAYANTEIIIRGIPNKTYLTIADFVEYLQQFPQDYIVKYDQMYCDIREQVSICHADREVSIGG